jgi:hypothetical protein
VIYEREAKSSVNLAGNEDNLKIMVDRTINFFLKGDTKGVLTLDRYRPVVNKQIRVENLITKSRYARKF